MAQDTVDPPTMVPSTGLIQDGNSNGQLRIYLSYDYLPSRNFYLLAKNINELYEFIFELIHNRPITEDEVLILDDVKTGNSVDVIFKILEKINPPKSVWITLSIVGILIIAHAKYYESKKINAEIELTKAQTVKYVAETDLTKSLNEKTKAETEKIKLENERLRLENELKNQNIGKGYRDKVLIVDNLKKIKRKLNGIENQLANKPINTAILNGNTIYKSGTIIFK